MRADARLQASRTMRATALEAPPLRPAKAACARRQGLPSKTTGPRPHRKPGALLMTDSKGMCDNPMLIKEFLDCMTEVVRLLPHDRNRASSMTKFKGASALPLWDLLRKGHLVLSPENRVPLECAETRQELG